jgi:hypothetical protein
MASIDWPTRLLSVASLHLDEKNPRLGREITARAPRDIIQYLFDHDKALDVASSIAERGFFPNEPLLAIVENGRHIVIEGNRRLAALKALREPGRLNPNFQGKVERLVRRMTDIKEIAKVPVTIAPSRRATDRQIVGRHIGTPVLAWAAENRASFILEKLAEGYENEELSSGLGFSTGDIQSARQTRAIADMARSIPLPDEVKVKLDNPRTGIFTTIERVFNSSIGRKYLMIEPDSEHGIRGNTTKAEFVKGYSKLVSDLALNKQSSRSLNKNEDIERYFESWKPEEAPKKKHGGFLPSDIIEGKSVASKVTANETTKPKRSKPETLTVLPKDFKVKFGNDRLIDIRQELAKLKREEFPNAGAVLLRVFFELTVIDYLQRAGEYEPLIEKLKSKKVQIPYGVPTMKMIVPEVIALAKRSLAAVDANKVEKALKYDQAAPFTISDLHGFVHTTDIPSQRDIQQFWLRLEPLFRLMLENDISNS